MGEQMIGLDGSTCFMLHAVRDIARGDEITVAYAPEWKTFMPGVPCRCATCVARPAASGPHRQQSKDDPEKPRKRRRGGGASYHRKKSRTAAAQSTLDDASGDE
jgi:hypothetical protein